MNTRTILIKGMHCRSCEVLIEDELMNLDGVKKAIVNEKKGIAQIFYKGEIEQTAIEKAVCAAGYTIGVHEEKPLFSRRMQDYVDLGFAFLIIVLLYMIGSTLGLFNLSLKGAGNNYGSLPVVLLVGLTAGISTCMALVGGLVLAASARFVEKHPSASALQKFKPHLFFQCRTYYFLFYTRWNYWICRFVFPTFHDHTGHPYYRGWRGNGPYGVTINRDFSSINRYAIYPPKRN